MLKKRLYTVALIIALVFEYKLLKSMYEKIESDKKYKKQLETNERIYIDLIRKNEEDKIKLQELESNYNKKVLKRSF